MKSPKDVLALGRVIVQQLELASRGDVLERWLAHHLAEVMDQVDRATGAERVSAEKRAVDLILKLWAHQRSLPKNADPLGGCRAAINVLSRLSRKSNPWMHIRSSRQYYELLHEMFEIHSRSVVAGLLLTQKVRLRELAPEESIALHDDEAAILSELEEWTQHYSSSATEIESDFADTDTWGTTAMESTPECGLESGQEGISPDGRNFPDESELHAAVAKDLERMRASISKLLKRWRKALPSESGKDNDA